MNAHPLLLLTIPLLLPFLFFPLFFSSFITVGALYALQKKLTENPVFNCLADPHQTPTILHSQTRLYNRHVTNKCVFYLYDNVPRKSWQLREPNVTRLTLYYPSCACQASGLFLPRSARLKVTECKRVVATCVNVFDSRDLLVTFTNQAWRTSLLV